MNERRYDVAARTRQLWVDDIAEFELTLEDVTTQVREDRRGVRMDFRTPQVLEFATLGLELFIFREQLCPTFASANTCSWGCVLHHSAPQLIS